MRVFLLLSIAALANAVCDFSQLGDKFEVSKCADVDGVQVDKAGVPVNGTCTVWCGQRYKYSGDESDFQGASVPCAEGVQEDFIDDFFLPSCTGFCDSADLAQEGVVHGGCAYVGSDDTLTTEQLALVGGSCVQKCDTGFLGDTQTLDCLPVIENETGSWFGFKGSRAVCLDTAGYRCDAPAYVDNVVYADGCDNITLGTPCLTSCAQGYRGKPTSITCDTKLSNDDQPLRLVDNWQGFHATCELHRPVLRSKAGEFHLVAIEGEGAFLDYMTDENEPSSDSGYLWSSTQVSHKVDTDISTLKDHVDKENLATGMKIKNLKDAMDNEKVRVDGEFGRVDGRIDTTNTNLANTETTLTNNIDSTKTTLESSIQSTKSNLQAQIDLKATKVALEQAKTSLDTRITNVKDDLEDDLDSEEADRKTADVDLGNRVDNALTSAKQYTNQEVGTAKTQLNQAITSAKNTAASDASTKANNALNSAKSYTNSEVGKATTTINSVKTSLQNQINTLTGKVNSAVSTANEAKTMATKITDCEKNHGRLVGSTCYALGTSQNPGDSCHAIKALRGGGNGVYYTILRGVSTKTFCVMSGTYPQYYDGSVNYKPAGSCSYAYSYFGKRGYYRLYTTTSALVWCSNNGQLGKSGSYWVLDFDTGNKGGWSNSRTMSTGVGTVHGSWGGNEVRQVYKRYSIPTPHSRVRARTRFWAIDSWDYEYAYGWLDRQHLWSSRRTRYWYCNNGWASYGGTFYNPWSGNSNNHKCYRWLDMNRAHTASTIEVRFGTNIGSPRGDESWAFDDTTVYFY